MEPTLASMTIPLLPDRDRDCTANLHRALLGLREETVAINLAQIPSLTSSALIELATFRRNHTGRIILQHPNSLVLRTLHIVGFNKLFTIEYAAT